VKSTEPSASLSTPSALSATVDGGGGITGKDEAVSTPGPSGSVEAAATVDASRLGVLAADAGATPTSEKGEHQSGRADGAERA
jgi:hypothetical protein